MSNYEDESNSGEQVPGAPQQTTVSFEEGIPVKFTVVDGEDESVKNTEECEETIPAVHTLAGAFIAFGLYALFFMVQRAIHRPEWSCGSSLQDKVPEQFIILVYTIPQIVIVPFLNVSLMLNLSTPGFDSRRSPPNSFAKVVRHKDFVTMATCFPTVMAAFNTFQKVALPFLPSIVHGSAYVAVLSLLNFIYAYRRGLVWAAIPTLMITLIVPFYGSIILILSNVMSTSPIAAAAILIAWPLILSVMEFSFVRVQGYCMRSSGGYSSREMYFCALLPIVTNEALRLTGLIALANPELQAISLSINMLLEILSRNNVTIEALALATACFSRCCSMFTFSTEITQYRQVYLGARVLGDLVPSVFLFYCFTVFWHFPYSFDLADCNLVPNEDVRTSWLTFLLIVAFSVTADVLAKGVEALRARRNSGVVRIQAVFPLSVPCALMVTLAAAVATFQAAIGAVAIFDAADAAGFSNQGGSTFVGV